MADGILRLGRPIILTMPVTILFALIAMAGQVRAEPTVPHVAAVAVARAQILSAVQVGDPPQANDAKRDPREAPPRRPRERPCPEAEATPCRLFVLDIE